VSRRAYRIEWAETAWRDLAGVIDYLSDRNPDAAAKLLEKLKRRAGSLRRSPGRGRVAREFERFQLREYRELVVPPYRLIYRVIGRRVLVLAVLDSRRNLEDLLLERLAAGS
jgi:toxin ParE1/3/4